MQGEGLSMPFMKKVRSIYESFIHEVKQSFAGGSIALPASVFDIRVISATFAIVFVSTVAYRVVSGETVIGAAYHGLYYVAALLLSLYIYIRILKVFKYDLYVPRKWVNFAAVFVFSSGALLLISLSIFFKDVRNTPYLAIAFATAIGIIVNVMLNALMKVSDKNVSKMNSIVSRDSMYHVLNEQLWNLHRKLSEGSNERSLLKTLPTKEALDFYDLYVTVTPYMLFYASPQVVSMYTELFATMRMLFDLREKVMSLRRYSAEEAEEAAAIMAQLQEQIAAIISQMRSECSKHDMREPIPKELVQAMFDLRKDVEDAKRLTIIK